MNYLKQMNAFNRHKRETRLSADAVALYMELHDYFNGLGWPERTRPQSEYIRLGANLSEKQFKRARMELVAADVISYTLMKSKTDSEGGTYTLIQLYKEDVAPTPNCPSKCQDEGQNKPQFVPNNQKFAAAYKNNNKSLKQREREAASGEVSLAISKFKAAFPGKSVEGVNMVPVDMDIDLVIKGVRDSPRFLMANDALCDLRFCVVNYSKIIAGRYKDSSLFMQPRAGPVASAAGPNDPLPGESEEAFRKRYNESNHLKD